MSAKPTQTMNELNRAERILAKARRLQLEMAMLGRVNDSARYAARAERVRIRADQLQHLTAPRQSA